MTYYSPPPIADDIAQRGTKEWRRAVEARRAWTGNELWTARAREGLDLGNPQALTAYLSRLGITDEVGGGRHAFNLFHGNLPSEGFGMSSYRPDISHALEAYMPDAQRWADRAMQRGVPRDAANAQFFPGYRPPTSSAGPAPLGPTSSTLNAAPAVGTTSTYGSSFDDDQTAFGMATDLFRKKRPNFTLGSAGSY